MASKCSASPLLSGCNLRFISRYGSQKTKKTSEENQVSAHQKWDCWNCNCLFLYFSVDVFGRCVGRAVSFVSAGH